MAHTTIVLSLSEVIVKEFESAINTESPQVLWQALTDAFDVVRSSIVIKRELYSRYLGEDERVWDYVTALASLKNELVRANRPITERELVNIVLSNVLYVYPEIAYAHTVHQGEPGEDNLTLAEAERRLAIAEQMRRERRRYFQDDAREKAQRVEAYGVPFRWTAHTSNNIRNRNGKKSRHKNKRRSYVKVTT